MNSVVDSSCRENNSASYRNITLYWKVLLCAWIFKGKNRFWSYTVLESLELLDIVHME